MDLHRIEAFIGPAVGVRPSGGFNMLALFRAKDNTEYVARIRTVRKWAHARHCNEGLRAPMLDFLDRYESFSHAGSLIGGMAPTDYMTDAEKISRPVYRVPAERHVEPRSKMPSPPPLPPRQEISPQYLNFIGTARGSDLPRITSFSGIGMVERSSITNVPVLFVKDQQGHELAAHVRAVRDWVKVLERKGEVDPRTALAKSFLKMARKQIIETHRPIVTSDNNRVDFMVSADGQRRLAVKRLEDSLV